MKKLTDEQLLEKHGWTLVCRSPYEVTHFDGSSASGYPARLLVDDLRMQETEETIELTAEEIRTLMSDVSNVAASGWSDSSYRIIEFIGDDPTEGL